MHFKSDANSGHVASHWNWASVGGGGGCQGFMDRGFWTKLGMDCGFLTSSPLDCGFEMVSG